MSLFVSCHRGLETLLQQELEELGITESECHRAGVSIPHTLSNIYLVNYCSRLAMRVLLPLKTFRCIDSQMLYKQAKTINWPNWLTPTQTFAIDPFVIHNPAFNNSLYAAQVLKDALCDSLRAKFRERPSVDAKNPDVQFNLFIEGDKATVSFDTSGSALFKRGWRASTTEAPLQETLAATILRLAGFTGEQKLWDPFCGSGTLLVEAAMIATHTPAGFYRKKFGFFNLPDFSESDWLKFKAEKDSFKKELPRGLLLGADIDDKALESAFANLNRAGFSGSIELLQRPIERLKHPAKPELIVTNPPYDKRLILEKNLLPSLGQLITSKQATGFALMPNETWGTHTGLASECKLQFSNGGIPIFLMKLS